MTSPVPTPPPGPAQVGPASRALPADLDAALATASDMDLDARLELLDTVEQHLRAALVATGG